MTKRRSILTVKPEDDALAELLDDASPAAGSLPRQRGKYAMNDFSALPLPRAAGFATDPEWEKAADQNAPRMLAEALAATRRNPRILDEIKKNNPALADLVRTVMAFVSQSPSRR